MANFSVAKVSSQNLNRVPIINGQMIFVPDTREIYFDHDDKRVSYCKPEVGSFAEWLANDNIYPSGTLLICTDRTTKDGVPIPEIKIANGVSTFNELPFITNEDTIVDYLDNIGISVDDSGTTVFNGKLLHALTIGDYVFDGTQDVVIPVYKGERVYS